MEEDSPVGVSNGSSVQPQPSAAAGTFGALVGPAPFGVVIEGYAATTAFVQVEQSRFLLPTPVPSGSSHKRLTFFLTQLPVAIPDGYVASLYASMYPHTTWRFLGYISNAEPSKILNIVWPSSDTADQPPEAPMQLGVTIESLATVASEAGAVGEQVRLQEEFGKAIGMDLLTFMESFNHGVGTAIFEKWFAKLQFKLRHKPEWAKYRG